jgi:hypothetical protein
MTFSMAYGILQFTSYKFSVGIFNTYILHLLSVSIPLPVFYKKTEIRYALSDDNIQRQSIQNMLALTYWAMTVLCYQLIIFKICSIYSFQMLQNYSKTDSDADHLQNQHTSLMQIG